MSSAQSLDIAILRTVLYADVFDFALTIYELHHYLLHESAVSLAEVTLQLESSHLLCTVLARSGDYVALKERAALFTVRQERDSKAIPLWNAAAKYARVLAVLPFVRMVMLTGALAMRNPLSANDDLDYLIVTVPGRVWLARLLTVILVRWVRLRGTLICPNFILAEDALAQSRRNLYIAHEIAQAVPFYNHAVYARLRAENDWALGYLPNATRPFYADEVRESGKAGQRIKNALEWLLSGRLGDKIEAWEQTRKTRRFQAETLKLNSAARVDSSQVKGHFNDHGGMVLAKYRERLDAFGLSEADKTEIAAD